MSFHFVNALWLGACFFWLQLFPTIEEVIRSGTRQQTYLLPCASSPHPMGETYLICMILWSCMLLFACLWHSDHFLWRDYYFLSLSGCHLKMWHSYEGLWAEGSLALLFVCIIHSEIQFCPSYFSRARLLSIEGTREFEYWEWTVATMQATKGNLWVCGGRSTIAAVVLLLVLSLAIEDVHRRCIQWMEDVKIWMWYLIHSIGLFLESLGLPSWRWKTFI